MSAPKKPAAPRLTRPLLSAIENALNAALASDGFDGGDFDKQNPEHFERALAWVHHKLDQTRDRT